MSLDPRYDPQAIQSDPAKERIEDLFCRALESAHVRRDAKSIDLRLAYEIVESLMLHQEQRQLQIERSLDQLMRTSSPTTYLTTGRTLKDEIKSSFRDDTAVHAAIGTGKTSALLEYAADSAKARGEEIGLVSPNRERMKLSMAKHFLQQSTHHFFMVRLLTPEEALDRRTAPHIRSLVVDDFWDLRPEHRERLVEEHHILAAVGTLPPITQIPLDVQTTEDRQYRKKKEYDAKHEPYWQVEPDRIRRRGSWGTR